MKFKTFDLNAYKSRAGITLSFDKKDKALGIITSKLFYLDSKHPLKLKITNNQAERYHIKQEIKQTDYKGYVTEGVMQLAEVIEEKVTSWDYHTAMTAFDIISATDVIELSNELGINEDRLTYAVMEVISKRKNGGMA